MRSSSNVVTQPFERRVADSALVGRAHRAHSAGDRDCEQTVTKVTAILDNPTMDRAIEQSESARDDAKAAAVSQREHPEDYPTPKSSRGA